MFQLGQTAYIFILIITIGVSLRGFRSSSFFDRYSFTIAAVVRGEWWRFITSGFLHVGTWHLLVNGLTFYFFAPAVTPYFSGPLFVGLYICSLLFGNFATYVFYFKQPYYTAVGASGAVSGIVFSSLLVNPGIQLYILPIPIPIPGPFFGGAYLLYSLYGIFKNNDRIGHAAHFGGSIGGVLYTLAFYPYLFSDNSRVWILLFVVLLAFVLLIRRHYNR